MNVIIHRPDKTPGDRPGTTPGFRIKEVHVFTCIDDDDTEGVIGMMTSQGWIPFVCADRARLDSLREKAQTLSNATGKVVKKSRYSIREDVEEIKPIKTS